MENSIDFFSDPPLEILTLMYSRLTSPRDLFNAWLANNRHHQRAIELALFNKREVDFYTVQLKILTILTNSKAILLGDDSKYLESLGRRLSSLLKNPDLSMKQLIQGLKLTAAIHKVPLSHVDILKILSISEFQELYSLVPFFVELGGNEALKTLVDEVQNKLNDENTLVATVAVEFLTALAQKADKKTLAPIVDSIKNMLDNSKYHKRESLKHLALLAPKIEQETIGRVVNSVKNILVSPDADFSNGDLGSEALNCLTALAPFLDKNTLETLIGPVAQKLDTIVPTTYLAAAKCLIAFASGMDKEIPYSLIINSLESRLDDSESHNRLDALKIFGDLAPLMDNTARNLLFDSVTNKLNDNNFYVRKEALGCLLVFIPGMDKEKYEPLMKTIINSLNDKDAKVRMKAVHLLNALAPGVEKDVLTNLIEPLKDRVSDVSDNVCVGALSCLSVLAHSMDNETQSSVIDLVQSKLDEGSNTVRRRALSCLAELAPMMKKETLAAFIKLAQDKLNDKNSENRVTALNFLATQAADKEMLKNIVESVIKNLDDPFCYASRCLALFGPKLDKVTLTELVETLKNKLDGQNGLTRHEALNCLIALTPSMDKKMLETLADSVKSKLYDPNINIRHVACHLMCYLLVNSDLSLKLDSQPRSTPESLIVEEIAGWVAQIQSVINEHQSLEAKDNLDAVTNARLS